MLKRDNLHNYQLKAINHIKDNLGSGLFLQMGLGKTTSTLTAYSDLIDDFEIIKPLIIAPLMITKSVWKQECKEWEHLKHLNVSVIVGTEKERIEALNQKADFYIINRENVVWLGEYYKAKFPFDAIIIDESSSFKNPSSKRFRMLRKIVNLPKVKRTTILTGTPSPGGYIDLWSQIFVLDKGERLGKNISMYRRSFFDTDYMGYNYIIKKGSDEIINDRIKDIVISMKAEDYLEMPEFIPSIINIPLGGKLAKEYDKFEDEMIYKLDSQPEDDDPTIVAQTAATLTMKLMQFSSGAIYDDNHNVEIIHDLKFQALDEIIEANPDEQILIAYNFKHEKDRLEQRYKNLEFMDKKMLNVDRWNNKEIKLLALHPSSAGHGLNLQKSGASLIVWFGFNWSLEVYEQFNARLYRQGQKNNVRCLHLAVGRVEYKLMRALADKKLTQDSIMNALKG